MSRYRFLLKKFSLTLTTAVLCQGLLTSISVITLCSLCYANEAEVCRMCGMDAARSQTEFVIHFSDGSKEFACCLHCVYLLQNFIKEKTASILETRDFTTGDLIDARQAYYLHKSSLIPKGSMAPFLPAFSKVETAKNYAKKYSGEVISFDEALKIVESFDKEVS